MTRINVLESSREKFNFMLVLCVHSVYLRQPNKLKAIIKLITALQGMKNADIKAKNSLSHEVI